MTLPDLTAELRQLDELGYAVVRGFLDRKTTAEIRAYLDQLAGPVLPADAEVPNRVRTFRHPIAGEIMPRLASNPRLIETAKVVLRVPHARDLRLLEQVLIRTDPGPGPRGAAGWHIDYAFLPRHYDATPRQTYYHMVHCCNTVPPGGAAFMIVPGSHRKTYAATAALAGQGPEALEAFKADVIARAGIDTAQGIEVLAQEGDLLVFNPMALHAGSNNVTSVPRYVYFASFMDASATDLREGLRKTKYRDNFPESLRAGLPAELQGLLEH